MSPSGTDAGGQSRGPTSRADSLTRRQRVLLHAEPLLALRRGDAYLDPELRHYDSLALALQAMRLIIERTGLDNELTPARLTDELAPLLEAMDRAAGLEPDRQRWRHVVETRIVGLLRNDAASRRPFEFEYTALGPQGLPQVRKLRMRFLKDVEHPSGERVLRLSDEAINLFSSALELDIEDAQAAAEAVIQTQIAGGRFGQAVQSAEDALAQSRRYAQKIAAILEETRRDVRRVDWRRNVPATIERAQRHIDDRLAVERNIAESARKNRDPLEPGHPDARNLSRIIELVRQCQNQHLDLQKVLAQAYGVFLDEQVRQAFTPFERPAAPDLVRQVIEPLLLMPLRQAADATEALLPEIVGASPPSLTALDDLVGWFLQPRRRTGGGIVEVEEAEITDLGPEPSRFPTAIQDRAVRLLGELGEPTPLSELLVDLGRDRGLDGQVVECVLLLVHYAYAPDARSEGEALLPSLPLCVERRGDERFRHNGYYGDDLVLIPLDSEAPDDGTA